MVQTEFYSDTDVSRILNMSRSWVRQQRLRRSRGLPNYFNLEARHIGGCVRYVAEEVHAFVLAHKKGGI
jgi:hypothetical protein